MDMPVIMLYLHKQLERLLPTGASHYCPVPQVLDEHKQGSALLAACGQNTEELDRAIATIITAYQNLKTARERAVVRFKLEGMSSSTTDEPKRKEPKAARLE